MSEKPGPQEEEVQPSSVARYLVHALADLEREDEAAGRFQQGRGDADLLLLRQRLGRVVAYWPDGEHLVSDPKAVREARVLRYASEMAMFNEALRREAAFGVDGSYTRPTFSGTQPSRIFRDSLVTQTHDLRDPMFATYFGLQQIPHEGLPLSRRQQRGVFEITRKAGINREQVPVWLPMSTTDFSPANIHWRMRAVSETITSGNASSVVHPRLVGDAPDQHRLAPLPRE
jgi:hypothetical protein